MIRATIVLFSILSFITGIAYPLSVTLVGKVFFPTKASGSLISKDSQVVGSALIGQQFTAEKYFWGRPSATAPNPYNAAASSGSNIGPSNPQLITNIAAQIEKYSKYSTAKIPVDLVTSSASGLDPEITPAGAMYQAKRVAEARNIPLNKVEELIKSHIEDRTFGFLGEPRVNVLLLNLDLDAIRQ